MHPPPQTFNTPPHTTGSDGLIYTWDLRTRRVLHQQRDEGAVGATSLALSPGGGYLASGSRSGVVNLYRRPQGLLEALLPGAELGGGGTGLGAAAAGLVAPAAPDGGRPLKALMNLTTSVDTLHFSPDGQVGCCSALCSRSVCLPAVFRRLCGCLGADSEEGLSLQRALCRQQCMSSSRVKCAPLSLPRPQPSCLTPLPGFTDPGDG